VLVKRREAERSSSEKHEEADVEKRTTAAGVSMDLPAG
jgi:hypothetical protein